MATAARDVFDFDFGAEEIRVRVPVKLTGPGRDEVFVCAGAAFWPSGPKVGASQWLDYNYLKSLESTSDLTSAELLAYLAGEQPSPEAPSFRRFYSTFLHNSTKGHRYRIRLRGGDIVEGVPTSGSLADPGQATFSFRTDNDALYKIPYDALVDAVQVDAVQGTLRERLGVAGSRDLVVRVPIETVEGLRDAPQGVVVVSARWGATNVAPTGLYKYLTLQGSDFAIDVEQIVPRAPRVLQLVVKPVEGGSPWA